MSANLFFNLPLQLALVDHLIAQVTGVATRRCHLSAIAIAIILIVAAGEGLFGASDQLVPGLAADEGLRR